MVGELIPSLIRPGTITSYHFEDGIEGFSTLVLLPSCVFWLWQSPGAARLVVAWRHAVCAADS